jgi:hypothetical protein
LGSAHSWQGVLGNTKRGQRIPLPSWPRAKFESLQRRLNMQQLYMNRQDISMDFTISASLIEKFAFRKARLAIGELVVRESRNLDKPLKCFALKYWAKDSCPQIGFGSASFACGL